MPKGRIRRALNAVTRAAKVVTGRQLTEKQMAKARKETHRAVVWEGKVENYGGFGKPDQWEGGSKTTDYFTTPKGIQVVRTRRSGTRNVGGTDREVRKTFTHQGQLAQKSVYSGLTGRTKTIVYDPPGRFFGRRVRKKR